MLRSLLVSLLLIVPLSTQAADFSLQDIKDKVHRLSDYRGKWVLVNFWATWCPPCLVEIPELNALHNAHKDSDLVVIGIAMESGSAKIIADFVKARGIAYPIVLGDLKAAVQIGPVDVLPSSYLYSPNGELVAYQPGEVTRAAIETYIKSNK